MMFAISLTLLLASSVALAGVITIWPYHMRFQDPWHRVYFKASMVLIGLHLALYVILITVVAYLARPF
jgi:hypothetical protein